MTDNDLQGLLSESASDGFAPRFADRVMDRLAREAARPELERLAVLVYLFRRAAVAALVLCAVLVVYNATGPLTDDYEQQTPVEAALSLPPLTVDAAYTLDLPDTP